MERVNVYTLSVYSSFWMGLWIPVFLWIVGNLSLSPTLANIRIENPWIRVSAGPNAALFMTIVNTTNTPEKLIDAQIDACEHAELHTHREENGIFRMREVEVIDIPAASYRELKPGGYHVMLMKIHTPLHEGERVPIALSFEREGTVTFTAPVKGLKEKSCCPKD